VLFDRAAVGSTAWRPLKLTFNLGTRLDHPALSDRDQQDGIDLCVDQILTGRDETEGAYAAAQNRNRFIGLSRLG